MRVQVGVTDVGWPNVWWAWPTSADSPHSGPIGLPGALPGVTRRGLWPQSHSRVARPEGPLCCPSCLSRRHESRGAARHPGQRHRSVGRGRARGPPLTPRPAVPGRPRDGFPARSPGLLCPLQPLFELGLRSLESPAGSGRRHGPRALHVPGGPLVDLLFGFTINTP